MARRRRRRERQADWWRRKRARRKSNEWPEPVPVCPFCGITYKRFRGPYTYDEAKKEVFSESLDAVEEGDYSRPANRANVLGRMLEGKRKAWNEHLWNEYDLWQGGELVLPPGPMPERLRRHVPDVAELVSLAELGEVPLPDDPLGEPDWSDEGLPPEAYAEAPIWSYEPIGAELEQEWFEEMAERQEVAPELPEFVAGNPAPAGICRAGWGAIAFLVGGYVWEDWLYPELVGMVARAQARARGKPMLSVGVGTPATSFRTWVLGPGPLGDVNADLAAEPGSGIDAADIQALPYPDKVFGAAVAAHVLEHVPDPLAGLAELERVTDGPVYVITPAWYCLYTWLHPDHRWLRRPDGSWVAQYPKAV